jgi:hypothetical protein
MLDVLMFTLDRVRLNTPLWHLIKYTVYVYIKTTVFKALILKRGIVENTVLVFGKGNLIEK